MTLLQELAVPVRPDACVTEVRSLMACGDDAGACQMAERAFSMHPTDPEVIRVYANSVDSLGRPWRALRLLEEAAFHSDAPIDIYRDTARILLRMQRYGHGRRYLRKVLKRDPHDEASLKQLVEMPVNIPDFAKDISADFDALQALNAASLTALAYQRAGRAKWKTGEQEGSAQTFIAGYRAFPEDTSLLIAGLTTVLPFVYSSDEDLAAKRAEFEGLLRELEVACAQDSTRLGKMLEDAAVYSVPYRIAYNGHNEVAWLRRYGQLISDAMARSFPNLPVSTPRQHPITVSGRKARIGVVSGYIFDHACWRNRRGFFYHLDSSRYELTLFDLTAQPAKDFDDITAFSHGAFDTVYVNPGFSLTQWARLIRSCDLDLLIYPELGMNHTAYCLAALRLAPIQARMAGHPYTCGLPTIDEILTSDLMEPADAQDHYTEKVVRLGGTGFFRYPGTTDAAETDPCELGLRPGCQHIFYGHNITKFLPADDDLLIEVARAAPDAQIVLLREGRDGFQGILEARLEESFQQAGLTVSDHILYLPKLSKPMFLALIKACDVYLDCPSWNGDNVTIDAIAQGLPIVARPGEFMRSRHSAAFLRRMGLGDYVCASNHDMAMMCVRLLEDQRYRTRYTSEIVARRHMIFREPEALASFNAYLDSRFEFQLG